MNIQISEEQYNYYFVLSFASWGVHCFTLRDDIYKDMKKKMDEGKVSDNINR